MRYARTVRILRIMPFLALIDCASTLFALSFGGYESFPLPAFFLNNWGRVGLLAYSLIIFTVLQLISEFLIIRTLGKLYAKFRRFVAILQFLTITLYYSGSSYWISIIVLNFLFPFNLGGFTYLIGHVVILVIVLLLFLYTRKEVLNIWSHATSKSG